MLMCLLNIQADRLTSMAETGAEKLPSTLKMARSTDPASYCQGGCAKDYAHLAIVEPFGRIFTLARFATICDKSPANQQARAFWHRFR
jgi:hypothetical protein